jgi:hypothetical protein
MYSDEDDDEFLAALHTKSDVTAHVMNSTFFSSPQLLEHVVLLLTC